MKYRLPLLASLAILWLAVIDAFTRVPLGPISLSGALTIAGAGLAIASSYGVLAVRLTLKRQPNTAAPTHSQLSLHAGTPIALTLFAGYALLRLVISPTPEGVQNVSVYISFVGAVASVAAFASFTTADTLLRAIRSVGIATSILAIVSFTFGLGVYGERAFALAGLVSLAATIPLPATRLLHRLAPFLAVLAIALSLSRTALAIAVAILPFLVLRDGVGGKFVRWALLMGIAGFAAVWLATEYAPIRDRFLTGDNAIKVGGLALNTSGRTEIWDLVVRSWSTAPMFGHGPGTATELLTATYPNISHPHNDYLRLLHDFGWLGLILFSVGYLLLLWRALRRARSSERQPIHYSAVLALLAVAAAAVTDNVVVYPFVMIPLGAIVGASMGSETGRRRKQRPDPWHDRSVHIGLGRV